MSNINLNDLDKQAIPFFARYLEEQVCEELSENEMEAIQGGKPGGSIGAPKKLLDTPQTQKFPSDREDSSPGIGVIDY